VVRPVREGASGTIFQRRKLSGFRGGVFRDWLIVWANHATMRTAIAGAFSEYSDYEVLSDDEIRSLREYNTTRLGIAHPLLEVPHRIVVGAYCQALRWLRGTCWSNMHGRNTEDAHE
jgi:hypothetical protein